MKTITLRGEKSISELIKRVYGQVGDDNASKLLEEALLRDNPQLSVMMNLPDGSLIKVPVIEGITKALAELEPTADPKAVATPQAHIDLSSYRQQLEEAIDQEMVDVGKQVRMAEEAVANQMGGASREQIAALIVSLKQRDRDLGERQKALESGK